MEVLQQIVQGQVLALDVLPDAGALFLADRADGIAADQKFAVF